MPTGSWARNARSKRRRFRAAISPVCRCRAVHAIRASTRRKLVGPGGEFSRRAPNLYQPACKPGSVWRAWLDARVTAIPLRRRLPGAFSNLPGRRDPDIDPETAPCSRSESPPCRPYSVLLPVGFALPPALPPARCALTAPFHPYRSGVPPRTRGCRGGGLFSVALSLGSRPPDVIRHRMSMEPGLSSRTCLSALVQAAVLPTDHIGMGCERPAVKVPIPILHRVREGGAPFNSSGLQSTERRMRRRG